jgi:hypothetical protein
VGKRSLRFDQLERAPGVVDDGFDLGAVANDCLVGQQAPDIALAEARDLRVIEATEGLSERVALAQNRQPREPRLKSLEAQLLE